MVSICVPSYQKREDSSSSYTDDKFHLSIDACDVIRKVPAHITAFLIEVTIEGRTHILEKRYSEFAELHKKLKKLGSTPDFPPKNVFKWHPRVLEQRKHMFEVYIQTMLSSERGIPKPLAVFLRLPLSVADTVSLSSSEAPSDCFSPSHQPVVSFSEEVYRRELAKSSLPDIITDGVLTALYRGNT